MKSKFTLTEGHMRGAIKKGTRPKPKGPPPSPTPKFDDLGELKRYLQEDMDNFKKKDNSFIPIMHNKDVVFLQLCGWSINLYADGTWETEVTEGG